MKFSNVGGQAVLEGVMMKNKNQYAVAVRKPDQKIEIQTGEFHSVIPGEGIQKIPLLRGVVNFLDSMILGVKTLSWSGTFFEEEEEPEEEGKSKKEAETGHLKRETKAGSETKTASKTKDTSETVLMIGTVLLSLAMAIFLFMFLPYAAMEVCRRWISSEWILATIEGVTKLLIFFLYLFLISLMKDIQRVFMYHGAEHKCINCIEHGMDLTVENVKKASRYHKRCGTSFLFFVIFISIIVFIFVHVQTRWLRFLVRILMIPVIAGISYEVIRLAGRSDSRCSLLLSKPGMQLQKLTTREPDEDMIEVGIASVEAVFDWKSFVEEVRNEENT